MINLMNLLSQAPKPNAAQAAGNTAGLEKTGQLTPEAFLSQLKELVGQNMEAASSAELVNLRAALEQTIRQGEQVTAELVALLQSVGLLASEINAAELDPLANAPVQELEAVLRQALESAGIAQELNTKAVDSETPVGLVEQDPNKQNEVPTDTIHQPGKLQVKSEFPIAELAPLVDLKPVLQAAITKCHALLSLQKDFAQINGTVPTGQLPEEWKTALAQTQGEKVVAAAVSWKFSAQVVSVQQVSLPETALAASGAEGGNQTSLIAVIRIRVQRIAMVWKELTGNLKATFEAAPQAVKQMEQLQTQSLWTLVRLIRAGQSQQQKPATDAGENPTEAVQAASPVIQELPKAESKAGADVLSNLEAEAPPQADVAAEAGLMEPEKVLTEALSTKPNQNTPARLESSGSRMPVHIERLVMTQTLDKIRVLSRNGSQEIQVRLDPPELGRMQMKLAVDGSSVAARVTVESESVKQVLENGLPQLREALSSQGLRVERFDVQVGFGFDQQEGKELRERWTLRRGWNPKSSYDLESMDAANPVGQGEDTGKRYGFNTVEFFV